LNQKETKKMSYVSVPSSIFHFVQSVNAFRKTGQFPNDYTTLHKVKGLDELGWADDCTYPYTINEEPDIFVIHNDTSDDGWSECIRVTGKDGFSMTVEEYDQCDPQITIEANGWDVVEYSADSNLIREVAEFYLRHSDPSYESPNFRRELTNSQVIKQMEYQISILKREIAYKNEQLQSLQIQRKNRLAM